MHYVCSCGFSATIATAFYKHLQQNKGRRGAGSILHTATLTCIRQHAPCLLIAESSSACFADKRGPLWCPRKPAGSDEGSHKLVQAKFTERQGAGASPTKSSPSKASLT